MIVPIAEISRDPRHPLRFEKKKSIWVALIEAGPIARPRLVISYERSSLSV
jgi:hypothetical protein